MVTYKSLDEKMNKEINNAIKRNKIKFFKL